MPEIYKNKLSEEDKKHEKSKIEALFSDPFKASLTNESLEAISVSTGGKFATLIIIGDDDSIVQYVKDKIK